MSPKCHAWNRWARQPRRQGAKMLRKENLGRDILMPRPGRFVPRENSCAVKRTYVSFCLRPRG